MKFFRRMGRMGLTALMMLALLALSGCMSGTADTIRGPGGVQLKLPKDASFSYLAYEQPVVLTNGQVGTASLVISNGTFKMNPEVIDAKTRRDIQLIQAGAAVGGQAAAIGMKAAGMP